MMQLEKDKKDEIDKKVIFKNCPPFTHCIREINNIQIDNAKDLDVGILMYDSIENRDILILQKHQEVYDNIIAMNQVLL